MTFYSSPPSADMLDRTRFPVDEWALREIRFDSTDMGATETIFSVANGYLGMRGNVEEGRETHSHGTFINGFHETWPIRHAEEAYGFARIGQTIVNVPDAKVIRLYVDDEPLLLPTADLLEYERSLNFASGVLTRNILWRTPSGKHVKISSRRMVSFTQRHLAVMTFDVTVLDDYAPVSISSQILNRQDGEDEYHVRAAAMGEGNDPRKAQEIGRRVLEPCTQFGDVDAGRMMLGYRCADSRMTLAVGTDHRIETDNDYEPRMRVEEDLAKTVFRVAAEPGVPIRLTKVVSYHTSRGVPAPELAERCERTLDRVAEEGAGKQFDDQRAWLDAYWERSDVYVAGQPHVQQAVRWNLFQLAQASARAEEQGIPAKGLTGSGYGGHYFWDAEIYVLPYLTYTSPEFARNALRFRYMLLDAARRRAAEMAQSGALFPWRTINGEEASAYYAAGTAQYHIDADIAYALTQYLQATGDRGFLEREGIDILVETARMWIDLGFTREETHGRFHIHGVTGPDEYTTVVNDNLYTNVMARFNLRCAADAIEQLREDDEAAYAQLVRRLNLYDDEVSMWQQAADDMAIPYDAVAGVHPQDQHFLEREVWDLEHTPAEHRPLLLHFHPLVIYRFQVLKQADVVLAMFLQGDDFTTEQKRANFAYYDPITTGDSSLSAVAQSIIAAEVGYPELALQYFHAALWVDLADRHGNTTEGVHVASTGGVWAALVNGFGGFGDRGGEFTLDPRLPEGWEQLTFRLTLSGTRVRVDVCPDHVELSVEVGSQASVRVREREVTVTAGEPVRVDLDARGPIAAEPVEGPAGGFMDDGTPIQSGLPYGVEPVSDNDSPHEPKAGVSASDSA